VLYGSFDAKPDTPPTLVVVSHHARFMKGTENEPSFSKNIGNIAFYGESIRAIVELSKIGDVISRVQKYARNKRSRATDCCVQARRFLVRYGRDLYNLVTAN
jgi:hypothetical protein